MIKENIALVRRRVAAACENAGRRPDSVRLLLAAKNVAPPAVRIAVEAGETLIGENRIQEYAAKNPALAGLNYERHFIGHLQTNKVKDAARYGVKCIHSLDSLELMRKLDARFLAEGRAVEVLIQVNTSLEPSKFGLDPEQVVPFLKELRHCQALHPKGFMTIGLLDADPEAARPSFAQLRTIRDRAIAEGLVAPDCMELSMGMSGDLEIAVEEGATIVRVGSAIFGQRKIL
jgi:pyridoxal phosphate enzyme (YggS family)